MAFSWNELGLDPNQIEALRQHGYETAEEVALAVAGAPETFQGLVDQRSIALIRKLVSNRPAPPLPPLGVPLSQPPRGLTTGDSDFESKRDAIMRELDDARNEKERRAAEGRLLDLYSQRS